MKSFIAFTAVYAGFCVGLVLSVAFCAAVGLGLGYLTGHTTTGVLCGLAWYGFGFVFTIDDIRDRLDERVQRLVVRL